MIYATLLRTSVVTIITFKWLFSSWTDATCLVMVYSFGNSCSHKCHIWKAFSFHELVKHVCVFTSIFRYSYSHRCHTWMVFFPLWTDITCLFMRLLRRAVFTNVMFKWFLSHMEYINPRLFKSWDYLNVHMLLPHISNVINYFSSMTWLHWYCFHFIEFLFDDHDANLETDLWSND